MFGLIFLLLIVVPALELYVLFQVADGVGWLSSIVLLVAISALGGALMKWQTAGAINRITQTLGRGEMPSKELADGALMIFGGARIAHAWLLHRRHRSGHVHPTDPCRGSDPAAEALQHQTRHRRHQRLAGWVLVHHLLERPPLPLVH